MPSTNTWPQRLARSGRRIAIVLAVFYVVIIAVFYFLQTILVFPGSSSQGAPQTIVQPPDDAELVQLKTASGETIQVVFGKALAADGQVRSDAASRPTIFYCYGNGMSLADCGAEFRTFRRLGANVLIPEYVGYGMSSGRPSEQACYETAEAAYAWLVARPDIDSKRVIISGWSLGSGVAVELASRHPPAGLMLFSAFTSMVDMGRKLYPILPVRWMLKHRFENLDKIRAISCPVILGHGTIDNLVPYEMSDQLAAAAPGPVARVRVEGAGHIDFWTRGTPAVVAAASRLVEAVAGEEVEQRPEPAK